MRTVSKVPTFKSRSVDYTTRDTYPTRDLLAYVDSLARNPEPGEPYIRALMHAVKRMMHREGPLSAEALLTFYCDRVRFYHPTFKSQKGL